MLELVLLCLIAAAFAVEKVLQARWTPAYYRRGIPVYRHTTAADAGTAIELRRWPGGGQWPGWARLVFERLSLDEVVFRESRAGLRVSIHGCIVEEAGRRSLVVRSDAWPVLAYGVAAIHCAATGFAAGAAWIAAAGAALIALQRMRAGGIFREMEQAD
jgi:hypothetical protein